MLKLRNLIQFIWPELILDGVSWRNEWETAQRDRFRKIAVWFFLLAGLGYIAHHYLLDIPNELQPIDRWFWFRVTAAGACLSCALFYASRWSEVIWYRFPAIIVLGLGCYAQSLVSLAAPSLAPWFYAFAFVIGAVLVLQMSALKSLLFSLPVMISFYGPLIQLGVALDTLVSATFFMSIVVIVARSSQGFELQAFALTKERDRQKEELIELQNDFSNRLKSFIPRVIANRMQSKIDLDRMTVIEASLEVLAPKKQQVACLFSDIRGFTEGSRDLDSFLAESVLPEVKACSDAVERFEGIPRKIGDLIFAYFDSNEEETNTLRATLAGISLSRINEDMNATVSSINVRRYILISTGEAIVGNVGGVNSGVEITALGSPVNFLSRLDDATKEPGLAGKLEQGDLLLCERSALILRSAAPQLPLLSICLSTQKVRIRDFDEVKVIYVLKPTDENYSALATLVDPNEDSSNIIDWETK